MFENKEKAWIKIYIFEINKVDEIKLNNKKIKLWVAHKFKKKLHSTSSLLLQMFTLSQGIKICIMYNIYIILSNYWQTCLGLGVSQAQRKASSIRWNSTISKCRKTEKYENDLQNIFIFLNVSYRKKYKSWHTLFF